MPFLHLAVCKEASRRSKTFLNTICEYAIRAFSRSLQPNLRSAALVPTPPFRSSRLQAVILRRNQPVSTICLKAHRLSQRAIGGVEGRSRRNREPHLRLSPLNMTESIQCRSLKLRSKLAERTFMPSAIKGGLEPNLHGAALGTNVGLRRTIVLGTRVFMCFS